LFGPALLWATAADCHNAPDLELELLGCPERAAWRRSPSCLGESLGRFRQVRQGRRRGVQQEKQAAPCRAGCHRQAHRALLIAGREVLMRLAIVLLGLVEELGHVVGQMRLI
jgi:hypothetical protein